METILKNLEAVLCDPEGKCCITGSAADRSIVDDALKALRAAIAQPAALPDREALAEAINAELAGLLYCSRTWEAWGVGTMTEEDFQSVEDSEKSLEIADVVLGVFRGFSPTAQPEETPDASQVNAGWRSFSQTAEYRQCLKWAKSNRAPGALFSAFLSGANSTAQPQQSTPAVQQGAAMPEFEVVAIELGESGGLGRPRIGWTYSETEQLVRLSDVRAVINPTGCTTP